MSLHIPTPLVRSAPLSQAAGRNVWLKLEALQPPGSFKIRGVGAACEHYASQGAKRFVSSSGGNAGLAVAYAGRHLGLAVTVVVPATTSERAKSLLRQEGAEVIVHGASWQEANALAQSLLTDTDAFIHPFDNPLLWTGHATMIDEVAASGIKPDAVLLSVGGGGLMAGVMEGLARNGWGDVPVLAVETHGAASLHAAMQAEERVQLDAITSIATSLGARQVCEQAFQLSQTGKVQSLLVSDREAVAACNRFLDDHRLLVEPACGAALAVAYGQRTALSDFQNVLVIVCGGATATADNLRQWDAAMPPYELAQLNIATMRAPMDSPVMADFVANLDPINALAEAAPGFVWRLKDEDGNATALRPFGEDILVNLSVWTGVGLLSDYVFKSMHVEILKRRKEWFEQSPQVTTVLWWVPRGHRPTEQEAMERLQLLRAKGPSPEAFGLKSVFAPPQ